MFVYLDKYLNTIWYFQIFFKIITVKPKGRSAIQFSIFFRMDLFQQDQFLSKTFEGALSISIRFLPFVSRFDRLLCSLTFTFEDISHRR